MEQKDYIPRLYGRQQDKPLKPRQSRLMDELLPKIAMPDPAVGQVDLAALFPQAEEIWLELGFGGGEHLAWHAKNNKRVGMIGAEPFNNGVGKLLTAIDENNIDNIRIHHGDGRPLMEQLPDQSLARLFVLHPDPWPKKRHFKRRIISPWFFSEAARLLRPGGELRVASDIPDYIRWTLMHYQKTQDFVWLATGKSDWAIRPDDWPQTRYEAKSLREGRAPAYLKFRRV